MSDDETEKHSLTSFLFGNVDEQGKLQEDFLDEETKAHLSNLGSFLNREPVFGRNSPASGDDDGDESDSNISKAESAEDFADINEIADDADDKPCCSKNIAPNNEESDQSSDNSDENDEDFDGDIDEADEEEFINALTSGDTPLACLLPEEFRNMDVRKFFPYFRKNKVLRFSRLFGPGKPSSLPRIWRGGKNRRKLAADKISTTPRTSEVEEKSEDQRAIDSISGEFKLNIAPTPPLDECETDDELKLMKPEPACYRSGKGKVDREENGVAAWRYGPAAYWYDQMGVSPNGEGFNYNMKLKPKTNEAQPAESKEEEEISPELFLPVNLVKWEDDVIWDGENIRQDVLKKLTSGRQPLCGWIPTQQTRTFESFMSMLKSGGFASVFGSKAGSFIPPSKPMTLPIVTNLDSAESRANFCVFPPDNLELIYGDWEKDVIIDPNNMERIPEPKVLTLDPSEDPLLYGIPEDIPREDLNSSDDLNNSKSSDRKEHQFTKKSQMILGKVAQRQREEEEEAANAQMVEKDPFNLSNDEFYLPKGSSTVSSFGGSMIQHSIPGQNLCQPFFPTHLNAWKLRHFHRLPLKRPSSRSVLSKPAFHSVQSLEKHIHKIAKAREQQRIASGGGEMFFMREPADLSGRDGELILCEYSEEHPSLIMQPGMATKIKNYYKRRPGKETNEPKFEYGETSYTHSSPFLGSLAPGESLQALENNLYRAPIFHHKMPSQDFLIIRDKHGYYIRSIPSVYIVGQQCPIFEVPSPNSKRTSNFTRDYLLVFIYRLFWQSKDNPRRLKMEDIRRAFPQYAESSIRKRLKVCSDFKRMGQGPESNYWVLRSDFRLPALEEVRAMVSPELCCAYFSMLAAEQRLKDAGYGERYFFTPEEDEDDNEQGKMADEIKCAPWNTTRAYISAMKGKCLLDLTGVADPTGCGEGFSYVKVTAKPPKDEAPAPAKRTVTGTDADLRKLSLKDAKQLLRDFGVKDDEIKTLTRWEIIDVIRTLSTQQARAGGTGITKFARGSMRYSLAEVQDRYKQDCQRIFDLQTQVLTSNEYLSTDEEESEGDSDIEEMGKNIEMMMTSKKGAAAGVIENEKKEREELQRLLRGETLEKSSDGAHKRPKKHHVHNPEEDEDGRKLKITRTRIYTNGQEYKNVEVITKPQLIEAYMKIRTTKDDAFIKHFAQMDEQFKEEKRREKRRLQDQLRRIRRNEAKVKAGFPVGRPQKPDKPRKTPPPPKPSLQKMRCSACGGNGHMKTNKNCPLYGKVKMPSVAVAPTDDQIEQEFEMPTSESLLQVEGTKLKISRAVVEQTEKMKKKALKLKFPKRIVQDRPHLPTSVSAPDILSPSSDEDASSPPERVPLITRIVFPKKGFKLDKEAKAAMRRGSGQNAEYLSEVPKQSVQRRRADPKVTMAVTLEQIYNELKADENSRHFMTPVSKKLVPDYYKIVKRPMDLQIIKNKLSKNQYMTREEFLNDVKLILDNSRVYNGDEHMITQAAHLLLKFALRLVAEKEQKLMKLEKQINPLLDDNDRVAFCYLLCRIVEECKRLPKSFTFHHPVDRKKYKNYHEKIGRPMDLGTMEQKCKRHMYQSVADFNRDVEQIYKNSEVFNGPLSLFTTKAKEIVDTAKRLLTEKAEILANMEKNIQASKDKAIDSVETESHATGASSLAGDIADRQTEDLIDENESAGVIDEGSLLQQDLLLSDGEGEDETPRSKYSESFPQTDFSALHNEMGEGDQMSPRREDIEEGELIESAYPSDSESRMNEEELAELLDQSEMARSGRLHTDLAMSDSDNDDDPDMQPSSSKRMRTMSGEEDCDFSTL